MPKNLNECATEMRRLTLMTGTAEMLAFPEMVCRHRVCQRDRRCGFDCLDGPHEPDCLSDLRPCERNLFAELFNIVADIHDNTRPASPSKNPEERELEEAAMAVLRALMPQMPDIAPRFADWCKRYHTPPAPPVDTAEILREMRAILAHDKAMDEISDMVYRRPVISHP